MDWFLYDRDLRHERIKWHLIYCMLLHKKCPNWRFFSGPNEEKTRTRQKRVRTLFTQWEINEVTLWSLVPIFRTFFTKKNFDHCLPVLYPLKAIIHLVGGGQLMMYFPLWYGVKEIYFSLCFLQSSFLASCVKDHSQNPAYWKGMTLSQ